MIYSLGLLTGIGGSILFSHAKGRSSGNLRNANKYFTSAVAGSVLFSLIVWAAFIVSVSRGCIVSGLLILLLPSLAGADSIWFAMPVTELLVAIYSVYMIFRCTTSISAPQKLSA